MPRRRGIVGRDGYWRLIYPPGVAIVLVGIAFNWFTEQGADVSLTVFADATIITCTGAEPIDGFVVAEDGVLRAAGEERRRGADAVKGMAGGGVASPTDSLESIQYTVAELRAAVVAAEGAGAYVLAHAYTPTAIRNAVEAGVRSVEHGNF